LRSDLEVLWVTSNVQITNEGMKSLAELKKLRFLSFYGCKQITDDGARTLKNLGNLKSGFFESTGVADVKKALPMCDVKR
jgi:hypothetical protein